MDNQTQEKKQCKNCKFFLQHYGYVHTNIQPVNCGHCKKRTIKPKERRSFPFIQGCELWEQAETKKDERTQSIKATLREIAKRLKEIQTCLKDDNQQ